jgi:predicted dehydrogenase
MDVGCYGLHAHQMLAPWAGGPPRAVSARGGERQGFPAVDEWLDADLEFPAGATGEVHCSMAGDWRFTCRIVGSRGEATAASFVQPQWDDRVLVTTPAGARTEELGRRSSYTFQLEAFAAHLRDGMPVPTLAHNAVTTMRLIDSCYQLAGFTPRPTAPRVAP